MAEKNGWEKDNKLTKKNNRTVYRDPETGKIYAFDTQHGRFEVLDKNGNHILMEKQWEKRQKWRT